MLRGALGFAGVSVAGFAVWAFAGKWIYAHVGEIGLYLICAIVFLAFSGLGLHPLARGPGSLVRFYKIFLPAFGVYAVVWTAAWIVLGFGWGEWLGSLAGSVVLALMIARGFGNFHPVIKVSIVMFVLHSAGYFGGGRLLQWLGSLEHGNFFGGNTATAVKLCWGLCYGLGVGAGLGYAFFTFQTDTARKPTQ